MEIIKDTLDDLLFETYKYLLSKPFDNNATRSRNLGPFSEEFGILLELTNPRARLSRSDTKGKVFSALGELLWYLDGNEDLSFIKYYISKYSDESYDKKTIYGAYGPRLYNSNSQFNQVNNILSLLQKNPPSRRAVIQIFESRDIESSILENSISIPCTCTFQFLQRDNRLNMITFMRSNDAFLGLPHDIYAFTMIQEYFASSLGMELGIYKHCVGSFHLYENNKVEIEDYIQEGLHSTKLYMPPMPTGDQKEAVKELLRLEKQIRLGKQFDIESSNLENYWKELAYLLAFFKAYKDSDTGLMINIREKLSNSIYTYILDKKIDGQA
jgi:thymidylate synthase